MFVTNLKIAVVVILTLMAYSLLANMIPQIESEVPEALELSGDVTPAELVAAGEQLFNGAGGCTACHGLGTRAPNLLRSEGSLGPISSRCADRESGVGCQDYLDASLAEPGRYVVEGYAAIMPDARRTLSAGQIWALVAFLESQGGQVTVTAEDIGQADAASEAAGVDVVTGGSLARSTEPLELMNELACLTCHQFGEQGNAIGPPLTDVGARRDANYIRESILQPADQVSEGYEAFAALMPPDFGERMTAAQLEALVEFLAAQR